MQPMQRLVPGALLRAHDALRRDLQKLEEAADRDCGESLTGLCARLARVRLRLLEHFRFEEQNGYLDGLRAREPRLERQVQELAAEHGRLAQTLEQLFQEIRVTTGPGHAFRDRLRAWVADVRHHESRENELVQDAFNQEIGAED